MFALKKFAAMGLSEDDLDVVLGHVRDFAAKQNAGVESFVAAEKAEAGMADTSRVFRETGASFTWELVGENTIEASRIK